MRVFLDANILFAAAKSQGEAYKIVEYLLGAGHELQIDLYVAEETRRNLEAKAPDRSDELSRLVSRVLISKIDPDLSLLPDALLLVEKDRPVLAAAIQTRCEVLLTGDKAHFGHLFGTTVKGVTVYSIRLLAELLGEGGAG